MRQIPNSNRVYPTWSRRSVVVVIEILCILEAQYIPVRPRTMCPALMLAASRTVRVIGRTRILMVSIRISAGFSQVGAPLGRRFAVTVFGSFINPERIRLSHRGIPKVTVRRRWEDILIRYGIIPVRFTTIRV